MRTFIESLALLLFIYICTTYINLEGDITLWTKKARVSTTLIFVIGVGILKLKNADFGGEN